jgi:hypothetical protein
MKGGLVIMKGVQYVSAGIQSDQPSMYDSYDRIYGA